MGREISPSVPGIPQAPGKGAEPRTRRLELSCFSEELSSGSCGCQTDTLQLFGNHVSTLFTNLM